MAQQERQRRLEDPLVQAARKADPEVMAQADQKLADNPNAGFELVNELLRDPRPTRDWENALLLHHKVRLGNELTRLEGQALRSAREAALARRAGQDDSALHAKAVEAEHRMEEVRGNLKQFEEIIQRVGTESGRGFRWRAVLMAEDFSLQGMLGRAEALARGRELTPEEIGKVKELQERIAELEKQIQADEEKAGGHGAGGGGEGGGEVPPGEPADEGPRNRRADMARARRQWNDLQQGIRDASLSRPQRVLRGALGVLDTARAIMTAFDLSAVFRQGGFLTFAHPLKALRAFPEMLRAFASERAADRAMQDINDRSNSALYRQAGLYLAEPGSTLSGQEEAFIGRWVRKIPGLAGSERAYNTFLNRMRADVFDAMLASFPREGRASPAEARAIADFINKATGRGGLGQLEKAAVPLSRLFFSPRFLASRFQLLAGQPFYQGTGATRTRIATEYARAALGVLLFYGLYKLADDRARISFDPRSADFGKVVTGHTHVDPLAGLAQVTVFMSRLASGQTKSTTTGKVTELRPGPDRKKFGQQTATDVISRFVRSKLAPIPGAVVNVLGGENPVGEPVTLKSQAWELAHPIAGEDVVKALRDQGLPQGAVNGLLAILGMGAQIYERRK